MEYAIIVIVGTLVLSLVVFLSFNVFIIFRRNRKTYKFMSELNDLVSETSKTLIRNCNPDNIDRTEKLIEKKRKIHLSLDYKKVVYSIKPFELSSWFTDKEIEILKQDKI